MFVILRIHQWHLGHVKKPKRPKLFRPNWQAGQAKSLSLLPGLRKRGKSNIRHKRRSNLTESLTQNFRSTHQYTIETSFESGTECKKCWVQSVQVLEKYWISFHSNVLVCVYCGQVSSLGSFWFEFKILVSCYF